MGVACVVESVSAAFVAEPAPRSPPLACVLGGIRKLACASADLGTGVTYLSEPLKLNKQAASLEMHDPQMHKTQGCRKNEGSAETGSCEPSAERADLGSYLTNLEASCKVKHGAHSQYEQEMNAEWDGKSHSEKARHERFCFVAAGHALRRTAALMQAGVYGHPAGPALITGSAQALSSKRYYQPNVSQRHAPVGDICCHHRRGNAMIGRVGAGLLG